MERVVGLAHLIAATRPGTPRSETLGRIYARLTVGDKLRVMAELYAMAKAKRGETKAEVTP